MSARLLNKTTLVTGAAGGIGAAICRRFSEEGAQVVVSDRDPELAEAVATSLRAVGGQALALPLDVCSEEHWTRAIEATLGAFSGLHVLVNNAGIALIDTAESAELADWQKVQQVNGEGVFLGTRAGIAAMKEGGGSIINLSSIAGKIGTPFMASYNYSKGGVSTFTKSAALHCAENGYPVRVNSIHPGYIDTGMFAAGFTGMPEDQASRARQRVLDSIPLGRLGTPRDIANGCVYLASDESAYVTGSELVIDGGYTAR